MEVQVTARGEVSDADQAEAREKVGSLDRVVKGPVLRARVVLTEEHNPRLERPARAEGEIDLAGMPVRARAEAPSMSAAVDDLAERLHRQLRRAVDRMVTRQREPAEGRPGEWRHGAWSPQRRDRTRRPPGDRRVLSRRSLALEPMTALEAEAELEALEHDFLLFHDVEAGTDAVLYRRDDGRLGEIAPRPAAASLAAGGPVREQSRFSAPVALQTAVAEMDELGHRFLFFENDQTGRGNVIYLRQDGHYGLIELA